MKINIILFGQLVDIAGVNHITLEDIVDTDRLQAVLQGTYPQLINSKYVVAVDKNIINENTILPNNCIVALLPPFSGG